MLVGEDGRFGKDGVVVVEEVGDGIVVDIVGGAVVVVDDVVWRD